MGVGRRQRRLEVQTRAHFSFRRTQTPLLFYNSLHVPTQYIFPYLTPPSVLLFFSFLFFSFFSLWCWRTAFGFRLSYLTLSVFCLSRLSVWGGSLAVFTNPFSLSLSLSLTQSSESRYIHRGPFKRSSPSGWCCSTGPASCSRPNWRSAGTSRDASACRSAAGPRRTCAASGPPCCGWRSRALESPGWPVGRQEGKWRWASNWGAAAKYCDQFFFQFWQGPKGSKTIPCSLLSLSSSSSIVHSAPCLCAFVCETQRSPTSFFCFALLSNPPPPPPPLADALLSLSAKSIKQHNPIIDPCCYLLLPLYTRLFSLSLLFLLRVRLSREMAVPAADRPTPRNEKMENEIPRSRNIW